MAESSAEAELYALKAKTKLEDKILEQLWRDSQSRDQSRTSHSHLREYGQTVGRRTYKAYFGHCE